MNKAMGPKIRELAGIRPQRLGRQRRGELLFPANRGSSYIWTFPHPGGKQIGVENENTHGVYRKYLPIAHGRRDTAEPGPRHGTGLGGGFGCYRILSPGLCTPSSFPKGLCFASGGYFRSEGPPGGAQGPELL